MMTAMQAAAVAVMVRKTLQAVLLQAGRAQPGEALGLLLLVVLAPGAAADAARCRLQGKLLRPQMTAVRMMTEHPTGVRGLYVRLRSCCCPSLAAQVMHVVRILQ